MTKNYHGCTGGFFDSPISWSDIYGWQYTYAYNSSNRSNSDLESTENYQWIREPSDQYWIIYKPDKKIESDITCFSCLFGILQIFRF